MNLLQKKQLISMDSVVNASSELVAANLDGEVVILGFKSGSYYSLADVGSFVWDLLQKPQKVSDLRDAILSEYEIEAAQCEQDLLDLLEARLLLEPEIAVLAAKNATLIDFVTLERALLRIVAAARDHRARAEGGHEHRSGQRHRDEGRQRGVLPGRRPDLVDHHGHEQRSFVGRPLGGQLRG